MRTELVLSIATCLVACSTPLPPHAPAPDGSGIDAYRDDIGPIVVHDSGPPDTGVMDASFDANVDAFAYDSGANDAGSRPVIRFDGVFDEAIWTASASNPALTNTTPVLSPFDGDSLTALHYARDADWLYLGFEGTLVTGDAVVFYVDTAPSPPSGVYLMATGLGDTSSTVNGVLSLPMMGTVDFQPEWGWGTSSMPMVQSTYEARIGWRLLAATGSFTPLTTDTSSVCTASACETAVRLLTLGVATSGPVHLVVRLGRPGASGGFSNQTFPTADTGDPQAIGFTTISVVP